MCTGVNIERVTKKKPAGVYHHGDLRNALVQAAGALAVRGGPGAVTVRAAAREVGVTPTAAYRHFTNQEALLRAAQQQAQHTLFTAMSADVDPGAPAIERLRAAGRGYITFALREPGLFRTAFCAPANTGAPADDEPAFALLSTLLDELVETGYTAPEHRPDAEIAAWASVHGVAGLLLDGVSTWMERDAAIDAVLGMVARGLATGPGAR
ncbi:TetR/AcrR family transcriptional regulator [Nocardia asteroides]|uniref:TetR/AcrR family transcriptional regulator n=1 Tax=Nocardia asteroides TaxID=1824 RepID=UPI001E423D6A|nr:TetR/AcrR family transcriptional regulator [Nocardia asteroides]UGT59316.1 TetR/AcrR family transcriptional regulator [Nocardia asteroides]